MKKFFVLLTVAALFVACGDESSSSAPASDLSEKPSSSIEMTNDSSSSTTVKNSSSSVDDDKSSSSVKKEESSSSAVKASSSSVTPKSSSSEEVKQSSSSVVASSSSVTSSETVKSSSSEYVPYNHLTNMGSTVVSKSEYKQFTDTRNGRSYYYLTINGKDKDGNSASVTVMAEMMNLPSECNTKSCANQIKPNHQGICPDGWRLLTEDDFYIVMHANENDAGAKGVRATSFGGLNYSGYSLLGAGYNWAYEFDNIGSATQWFYPVESIDYPDEGAPIAAMSKSSASDLSQNVYKTYGSSVRCVKAE